MSIMIDILVGISCATSCGSQLKRRRDQGVLADWANPAEVDARSTNSALTEWPNPIQPKTLPNFNTQL